MSCKDEDDADRRWMNGDIDKSAACMAAPVIGGGVVRRKSINAVM